MNTPKFTIAAAWSASITVLFITFLTVLGDIQAPVKDWLTTTFSHHWLGKSILAVLVFALFSVLFSLFIKRTDNKALHAAITVLITASVFGALVLTGFPLWETFVK